MVWNKVFELSNNIINLVCDNKNRMETLYLKPEDICLNYHIACEYQRSDCNGFKLKEQCPDYITRKMLDELIRKIDSEKKK